MNKYEDNKKSFQYTFEPLLNNHPHQIFENHPTSTRLENKQENSNFQYYSNPTNQNCPINFHNNQSNYIMNIQSTSEKQYVDKSKSEFKNKYIENYQTLPKNMSYPINNTNTNTNTNINLIMPMSTRMNNINQESNNTYIPNTQPLRSNQYTNTVYSRNN